MTNEQKQIISIITQYLENNEGQRFGQALFNLKINQFDLVSATVSGQLNLRDIYNDSDEIILRRIWSIDEIERKLEIE